jgi:hypothetical protein
VTPDRAATLLAWMPFIEAVRDGKTVQSRVGNQYPWLDVKDLALTIDHASGPPHKDNWRIKPEPQDFWLCSAEDKVDDILLREPSPEVVKKFKYYKVIHVREVLPE